MNNLSVMLFGIHQGKIITSVPADYLVYLYENNKCFGALKNYIINNMDSIKKRAEDEKQK